MLTHSSELVITSFPRRWGYNRNDDSGIYKIIRDRLQEQQLLGNVYDAAAFMIDQCSRFFFDRSINKDNRPEVLDMFSNAIGLIV
jgi:hypothetical protein